MTRKPPNNASTEATHTAILALTSELYKMGKAHIAAGNPVTQRDMAIMNMARRALKPKATK